MNDASPRNPKRLNLQLDESEIVEIKGLAAKENTTPGKAILKAMSYYVKANNLDLSDQFRMVYKVRHKNGQVFRIAKAEFDHLGNIRFLTIWMGGTEARIDDPSIYTIFLTKEVVEPTKDVGIKDDDQGIG